MEKAGYGMIEIQIISKKIKRIDYKVSETMNFNLDYEK